MPVGINEVDRVLGGGLVPGSVTLLSGEPGVGKSTLTLQISIAVANSGAGVLLVTGEEAPGQVAARANRTGNGDIPDSLRVLDSTKVEAVAAVMTAEKPQMVIVDSIQTMVCAGESSAPGSVPQVKSAAVRLAEVAKERDISLVLIGHVTKDGSLAGPRQLEHLVDTVLTFGGDRHHELRFLRVVKHRFGPTSDVGVFEMNSDGLEPVRDPSARFLVDRNPDVPGSIVVPVVEGQRPVMVEVQALATKGSLDQGLKLAGHGLTAGRLRMLGAVGTKHLAGGLADYDALLSVAGGAKVDDPGADLGVLCAVLSSVSNHPIPPDLVACAEIGLGGELRRPHHLQRRLQEAFRLGFRRAVVPASSAEGPTGLALLRAATVHDARLMLREAVQS